MKKKICSSCSKKDNLIFLLVCTLFVSLILNLYQGFDPYLEEDGACNRIGFEKYNPNKSVCYNMTGEYRVVEMVCYNRGSCAILDKRIGYSADVMEEKE